MKQKVRLVCIGDSLTYGYGLSESWPSLLRDTLEKEYPHYTFTVSNLGMCGACVKDFMNMTVEKRENTITVATVQLGSNDADSYNWINKEHFEEEYNALLNNISAEHIILLEPGPVTPDNSFGVNQFLLDEVRECIRKTAEERNLTLVKQPYRIDQLQSDGAHPNSEGAQNCAMSLNTVMKFFL